MPHGWKHCGRPRLPLLPAPLPPSGSGGPKAAQAEAAGRGRREAGRNLPSRAKLAAAERGPGRRRGCHSAGGPRVAPATPKNRVAQQGLPPPHAWCDGRAAAAVAAALRRVPGSVPASAAARPGMARAGTARPGSVRLPAARFGPVSPGRGRAGAPLRGSSPGVAGAVSGLPGAAPPPRFPQKVPVVARVLSLEPFSFGAPEGLNRTSTAVAAFILFLPSPRFPCSPEKRKLALKWHLGLNVSLTSPLNVINVPFAWNETFPIPDCSKGESRPASHLPNFNSPSVHTLVITGDFANATPSKKHAGTMEREGKGNTVNLRQYTCGLCSPFSTSLYRYCILDINPNISGSFPSVLFFFLVLFFFFFLFNGSPGDLEINDGSLRGPAKGGKVRR